MSCKLVGSERTFCNYPSLFCAAATKGYLSVLLFHRLDPYRLATQFQVMKNSDAKKPDCAWFVYLLSFTPADSGALWSLTVSEQGGI